MYTYHMSDSREETRKRKGDCSGIAGSFSYVTGVLCTG